MISIFPNFPTPPTHSSNRHQSQPHIDQEEIPPVLTHQHMPKLNSPLTISTSQLDVQKTNVQTNTQEAKKIQLESWRNFRDVKVQEIVDSKIKVFKYRNNFERTS